jgi:hypothetical protein
MKLKIANVNWNDPRAFISEHFRVVEALYLPKWDVFHMPSIEEKQNILRLAAKMEAIRAILQRPISITSWIRPILNNPFSVYHGEDYNLAVNGREKSMHKVGRATDWSAGEDCDKTRSKLLPHLETLGIRMEDLPGSNWVHIDDKPIGKGQRFFKP